jgi:hypothetical protein
MLARRRVVTRALINIGSRSEAPRARERRSTRLVSVTLPPRVERHRSNVTRRILVRDSQTCGIAPNYCSRLFVPV